ncbi:hypothetical protein TI39_contig5872g00008 [Zymoseptoria brevis]|uniref:Uncharacterized protein n=1 Tax=Zymoseptoria brevis TaxID=1047168 RepID=A0A0F4G4P6_9PEZI|nr:hypothetical protein TI39_contig5872g00008 [Zymoseptoria brevis]
MIGKLPNGVTIDHVEGVLKSVPLPVKNQNPEQNCYTWLREAIVALQQAGYADAINVNEAINSGMARAQKTLDKGRPKDWRKLFENATKRPL